MFDIGWTELLVLAVVAILIVGPKDLPRMLYSLGQTVNKLRRQADEFRRQFNESMREAGMDDVRNDMKKMSDLNPTRQIKDEIESTFRDQPTQSSEAASGSDTGKDASDKAAPASETHPAEGDILAESGSEPSPAEKPADQSPSPDAQPGEAEETAIERKKTGNRTINGSAAHKDAVS